MGELDIKVGPKKTAPPVVSIIMPIYNGAEYLRPALDSILKQTFKNFELIIINDGSQDDSRAIVESYTDDRIRLTHQKNRGLVATLNRAIGLARGQYIARHDCDDLSRADRLALQVAYLEGHPDVVLLGSGYNLVNEAGKTFGTFVPFTDDTTIRQDFMLRNPFGHGTIMFRRSIVKEAGGYAPLKYTEDYEYWWRLAGYGAVANLPEALYDWRVLPSSMSHTRKEASNWLLINRLRKKIWQTSNIQKLAREQFAARAVAYRQQSDPAAFQQFINLQVALSAALQFQDQPAAARQLLWRTCRVYPKAIRRYQHVRRHKTVADYDVRYFSDSKIPKLQL